jgi:prepilin peptidase CpaA
MTFLPPLFQLLLLATAVIAALTDVRSRRIPNWLVLGAAGVGFGLNAFAYGRSGAVHSLKGLGLALLIYVPLFLIRAMGAGDAKLMGAIGAIVGAMNWVGIFLVTAISGGLLAFILVLMQGRARSTAFNILFIIHEIGSLRAPHRRRADLDVTSPAAMTLPHAVSVAVGVVTFLAASWIWAPR